MNILLYIDTNTLCILCCFCILNKTLCYAMPCHLMLLCHVKAMYAVNLPAIHTESASVSKFKKGQEGGSKKRGFEKLGFHGSFWNLNSTCMLKHVILVNFKLH